MLAGLPQDDGCGLGCCALMCRGANAGLDNKSAHCPAAPALPPDCTSSPAALLLRFPPLRSLAVPSAAGPAAVDGARGAPWGSAPLGAEAAARARAISAAVTASAASLEHSGGVKWASIRRTRRRAHSATQSAPTMRVRHLAQLCTASAILMLGSAC